MRKDDPSEDFQDDSAASSMHDEKSEDNAAIVGASGASRKQKIIVVLTTLFLAFGANYMAAALPTLKPFILKNIYYHDKLIDNTKYGVMTSSSTLINTVWPFFLGVLIDMYGPSFIAVICSTCIVVGSLVLSLGASRGDFSMINGGEILLGVGNITIHMCQLKLYAHWFRGSALGGPGRLSFVTGLDVAIGRVFGLIGSLVPVPVYESTNKWYWGFWIGLIFSAFAWVLSMVYLIYERTLPSRMRFAKAIDMKQWNQVPFWKRVVMFFQIFWRNVISVPAAFWILMLVQLLQTGAVATYGNNAVDIMTVTRGDDTPPQLNRLHLNIPCTMLFQSCSRLLRDIFLTSLGIETPLFL